VIKDIQGLPHSIAGFRIIESKWMVVPEVRVIKRSWIERLFSRPWTPLTRVRHETVNVPLRTVYRNKDMLIMHPEIAREIRSILFTRDNL
jgi:hypothetical protein